MEVTLSFCQFLNYCKLRTFNTFSTSVSHSGGGPESGEPPVHRDHGTDQEVAGESYYSVSTALPRDAPDLCFIRSSALTWLQRPGWAPLDPCKGQQRAAGVSVYCGRAPCVFSRDAEAPCVCPPSVKTARMGRAANIYVGPDWRIRYTLPCSQSWEGGLSKQTHKYTALRSQHLLYQRDR